MPHWRSFTEREYIYAYDLGGQDRTLTIDKVLGATVVGDKGKKSKKPIVFFRETKVDAEGKKKGLVLNATNGKAIASMYGNETEAWIGKRVTLYPTTTESGGETVDCIRIRKRVPPAATKASGSKQPERSAATEPSDAAEPHDAAEPPDDGPPDDYVSP